MKTKSITSSSLGQRLHSLRKYHDLSLQELSEITGISRSNLNRYECDESRPTTDFFRVLCEYYQVSSDYLLFGVQTEDLQREGWSRVDPELKAMVNRLSFLMNDKNPHMRSWAIVQFTNAFEMRKQDNSPPVLVGTNSPPREPFT